MYILENKEEFVVYKKKAIDQWSLAKYETRLN